MSFSYYNWYYKPLFIYLRFVGMTLQESFFSDVSLWNQYKYIAFNISSCKIFIILYKMLIITKICEETRNELTIYATLCPNVTIFYRQKLAWKLEKKKNWNRVGIQSETFRVAVYRLQSYKNCMATCNSFHQTWSFAFLRQLPFVKLLSSESTSKLL